jgi:MerR family transcriptional regulator/heat shock protein HspR
MRIEGEEILYHISLVAEQVECHPQTLRMYERLGLVEPRRSHANVRLYSLADIERVRQIKRLTQELGVNLAGVEVILKMLDRMDRMGEELERLREALARGPRALGPARLRASRNVDVMGKG